MIAILPYIQIILSVVLIAAILMQQSEAGLGSAFGGGSDAGFKHTRRGFEKVLFNTTSVIAILFALSSILALIL